MLNANSTPRHILRKKGKPFIITVVAVTGLMTLMR